MDPQHIQNNEIRDNLARTRSISAHFPQNSPMHSLSTLYENAMQNQEFQNQSTSTNRSFDELRNDSADTSRNERDQLLNQRSVREGLEQFRLSLDNTREGQTFISIVKNVLPFVALFAAKFMFDHLVDILEFFILFAVFFQADIIVQKIMSGGFTNKFLQFLHFFGFSILTAVYLHKYSLDDFEFSNTFGLNIMYFVSGEYKELSMSSTLYGVIIIDTSFKLITVVPKSLVGEVYRYSLSVKKSVRCLVTDSSVGTSVKLQDCEEKQCTVCHDDLSHPIKLECNHVFCKSCIETWLDQKSTCPMCRAEVTKDVDNEWKNGGTSLALRMF
uniref:RING-type domain-containing protein n=1 Tax=Caenorhabditis tropicalis TaxID=1561998 RepID=A0A1I7SZU0_9PELO